MPALPCLYDHETWTNMVNDKQTLQTANVRFLRYDARQKIKTGY